MEDIYNKEFLSNGIFVYTSKEHTFGTDAILLAYFASPSTKSKVVDFGSGCGIIPLFFYSRNMGASIYGIELQKKGHLQLEKSVVEQEISSVFPINCDLKKLKGVLPFGTFDVVTMNPPYKQAGGGIISQSESDKIARHETTVTLDDVCKSASELLKFGGKLCLCGRPERLATVFESMRKNQIEPKRLRFVSNKVGEAPWLYLVEGKKGRKEGLTVEPVLYIRENEEYSEEYKKIYNEYQG